MVTENKDHSKSVSIGVWVLTGTRDEPADQVGISHLLEHLVFKGTKNKSAYQIAKSLESLGGELNAYTTREYTNYHCTVLKDDWQTGLEVLSDLACNMKLSKKDFELEKKVILQEISMSDDTPEEIVFDYLYEAVYAGHPLSRQILGKSETIQKMTQKKVLDYYKKYYQGKNLIISASGPIDHDAFVVECQRLFKNKKKFSIKNYKRPPAWKTSREIYSKDLEQAHILIAFPSTSFKDQYRFEALIVNSLLGGGMTSKLYQTVREKQGLAYSIFSLLNTQTDSGNISIYAATDSTKVKKVVHTIADEILKIKKNGIRKSDLDLFKRQVRGQLLMGSDDIDSRMTSLGINEMIFEDYKSVDHVIAQIEKINMKSINQYLKEHFNLNQVSVILMGSELHDLKNWIENYDFSKKR